MGCVRLLVAVPALNEEETVAMVVQQIRAAIDADVIVVDDHSRDRTAQCAREAGAGVLQMPFTVGVGGAMRTAFRFAQRHGYDAVVQVDGDGQHDPQQIPLLLDAISEGASVVVGSRFVRGYRTTPTRRLAMRVLARGASRLTGATLTDTTSGFRCADRRAIDLFADRYPAEYLGDTTESLVVAARAGLPLAEVPVSMRPRQGGAPSHRSTRSVLYLGRVVMALVVAAMAKRQTGLS